MLAYAKINCLHCCLLLVLYILVQQGIFVLMILYIEMHTSGNNRIDWKKITKGYWVGKFSLQKHWEEVPKQLCKIQVEETPVTVYGDVGWANWQHKTGTTQK